MDIEVNLTLTIDPDANFLECDDLSTLEVLKETIKLALYQIDDIKLNYIELEKT
jgi:hypothetical protein